MPKHRIESLADGVFAIVMTILILELKLPSLEGLYSDVQIWQALSKISFVLLIYFTSFTILGGYWLSHHFLISIFSKNADRLLPHLNLLFLSLIALIPFSAHLWGLYPDSKVSVWAFGTNIIAIGVSLMLLRWHIYKSREIENLEISKHEFNNNLFHLSLPPLFASFAIIVAYWNPQFAIFFFIIPAIINIIPGSLSFLTKTSHHLIKLITRQKKLF